MSETKVIIIPKETVKKLKFISKNFSKLNVSKKKDILWLASENSGGYEWGQTDLGISKEGQFVKCFQNGCSCNGANEPTPDKTYALEGELSISDDDYYSSPDIASELIETTNILYEVLKKRKVDTKSIINLPNAEIRRAVIELMGMEKFIKGANPTVEDSNETHGELLRIKLEGDEDLVLLHVKDPSTTREYFLRVPPDMKTSLQARAWTFGFNENNFNPTIET